MRMLASGFLGVAVMAAPLLAATAFAAPAPILQNAQIQTASSSAKAQPGTIEPLGVNPPNTYWNLDGNPYSASFSGVSNAGIYTNYYFSTNGSGDLYVNDINLYGDNAEDVPCQIDLWNKTTGEELYYTDFTTDTGDTYSINYTGLNKNDFYYIGIEADTVNETIDGNFKVSWSS